MPAHRSARASVWIQNNGNWTGRLGGYNTNWQHDEYTVTGGVTHNHFGIDQGF